MYTEEFSFCERYIAMVSQTTFVIKSTVMYACTDSEKILPIAKPVVEEE